MLDKSDFGILRPTELALVSRVVDRLCRDRGFAPGGLEAENLARQAFYDFQLNRALDEAALEATLRETA